MIDRTRRARRDLAASLLRDVAPDAVEQTRTVLLAMLHGLGAAALVRRRAVREPR